MWRDHRHPVVHWYYTRHGDARTLLALSVFPAHPAFALCNIPLRLSFFAEQHRNFLRHCPYITRSLARETTIRSDASLTYRYQGDVSFYSHYCERIWDVIWEERYRTIMINFKFNLSIIIIGRFFRNILLQLDKSLAINYKDLFGFLYNYVSTNITMNAYYSY